MYGRPDHCGVSRRGWTLIELLVVLAILGLLAALVIPAVGAVRETSRRATCLNHLHQLGVAWESARTVRGVYPTRTAGLDAGYRPLLLHLEQKAIHERLTAAPGGSLSDLPFLEVFGCPSDGEIGQLFQGDSNYLLNDGTRFRHESPDPNGGGMYGYNGFGTGTQTDLRPEDITDGLSNTAAMSERLVVDDVKEPSLDRFHNHPGRYYGWTPRQYVGFGDEPAAIAMCRSEITEYTLQHETQHCGFWLCNTGYDHMLTPNLRACYNATEDDVYHCESALFLKPASSAHPGGVNALMADGRVTFVAESIGEAVWTAVGTRTGAESVSLRN